MSKVTYDLKEAILQSGLKDGMTVSFHHHLRNGDKVINLVMDQIAQMGYRDLTLNVSSLMEVYQPLVEHIKSGVITGIEASYISAGIGRELGKGILPKPAVFRSHGGRASDIVNGLSKIDVAFIAASACDRQGNCTGRLGQSAFGGIGYAKSDAQFAGYKICLTDNLVEEKLQDTLICADEIDRIVVVDSIGDADGIVSATTQITKSPTRLKIARDTVKVITASGAAKDGMNFQTGAGGISLAVSKYLHDYMVENGIHGESCIGGITGFQCDMLEDGCFESIYDVQCFDRMAAASMNANPKHFEISAEEYASPTYDSYVNKLDVVILGATEIDLNYNVNVHTDSFGRIMGGSGGHSDAAQGAKITIIVAPLMRGRLCVVQEKVLCVSTPGKYIDVLVTEYGVAVNPANKELRETLIQAGIKLVEMEDLYEIGLRLAGKPNPIRFGEKEIAKVVFRDGTIIDTIYDVL